MDPSKEWSFTHSIVCPVTLEFAWKFWTTVSNWGFDPDVETIELNGAFAAGVEGVTRSKSIGEISWRIAEVRDTTAVVEFPLSGAVGRFSWAFERVSEGTRITQSCAIAGEKAAAYIENFGPKLESDVPAGMSQLCARMRNAVANR